MVHAFRKAPEQFKGYETPISLITLSVASVVVVGAFVMLVVPHFELTKLCVWNVFLEWFAFENLFFSVMVMS